MELVLSALQNPSRAKNNENVISLPDNSQIHQFTQSSHAILFHFILIPDLSTFIHLPNCLLFSSLVVFGYEINFH